MSSECIFLDLPSYNNMSEVIFRDESGKFPQADPFDQETNFKGLSIGFFKNKLDGERAGTGFVVKVLESSGDVAGLILTAAHIFINSFEYSISGPDFILGKELFDCKPLKNYIDWDNELFYYRDPITRTRISIPEDWVICEILRKKGLDYKQKIVPLNFMDPSINLASGTSVFLVGYPRRIRSGDIGYISPEANGTFDFFEISRSLLGGNELIKTEGLIITHEEMICVTCSSANGMSGSPLLIKESDEFKVIGILHGGPASPFHYFVSQIMSHRVSPVKEFCDKIIEQIDIKLSSPISDSIKVSFGIIKESVKSMIRDGHLDIFFIRMLDHLYSNALSIEYGCGNCWKHNLVLPLQAFWIEIERTLNSY